MNILKNIIPNTSHFLTGKLVSDFDFTDISLTDRRFHIKIGFEALDKEGIALLCKSYFDKFEFSDFQINEIFNSGDVTPGDFGSLFGRIRFTNPEEVTPDFICNELIKVVKGKKRSWENTKSIGFCG